MKVGGFLGEETDNNTAVIGEELAKDLFDTDRPIGQVFTMRSEQFSVIGVIQTSTTPINYNNVDLNHAVVVSFERGKLFHQDRSQDPANQSSPHSADTLGAVTKSAYDKLLSQHLMRKTPLSRPAAILQKRATSSSMQSLAS